MARDRHRTLRFPAGGVDRRYGFQNQRPFTTADALNVRPDGTIEGRERGGSRPGLERAYGLTPERGPIRMLADVVWGVPPTGDQLWQDYFADAEMDGADGSIRPRWTPAPWVNAPENFGATKIEGQQLWYGTQAMEHAWLGPLLPIDRSKPYSLELHFRVQHAETPGAIQRGQASLFLLLNDSASPEFQENGLVVTMTHNSGASLDEPGHFQLTSIARQGNGILSSLSFGDSANLDDYGPLLVEVKPQENQVTIKWGGVDLRAQHGQIEALPNFGTRFGFGARVNRSDTWIVIDKIALVYTPTVFLTPTPPRSVLFFLGSQAGVHIRYETPSNISRPVENPTGVVVEAPVVRAASHNQALFIADYDAEAIPGGSPVEPKVVRYSVANERWELHTWEASDTGEEPDGVEPGIPQGNRIIVRWHDRILLAGALGLEHIIFASALGDPYDWNYGKFLSEGDSRGAWATQTSDAGALGEPVAALVPHTLDYLIIGAVNSIWAMRGDIAFGGQIENVSPTIGFVSQEAWCITPAGDIVFLTADGLYGLRPGPGQEPQSISRERLPQSLLNISPTNTAASLAYDIDGRGIHIFLSPRVATGVVNRHWWFDWETKSFWPVELADEYSPMLALQRQSPDPRFPSGVFLGCRSGGLRMFNSRMDRDDGLLFNSHVMYGPIPIGGNGYEDGLLLDLVATLAAGSSDVEWSAHVGASPEAASRAPAFDGGTWHAGVNHTNHPHARGNAFYLKVQGKGSAWAMESIDATTMKTGKQRLP